ncbi:hypothetical protein Tco_1204887 [Tanacetum coccineum]
MALPGILRFELSSSGHETSNAHAIIVPNLRIDLSSIDFESSQRLESEGISLALLGYDPTFWEGVSKYRNDAALVANEQKPAEERLRILGALETSVAASHCIDETVFVAGPDVSEEVGKVQILDTFNGTSLETK